MAVYTALPNLKIWETGQMPNCLWKHTLVPLNEVRDIYSTKPEVVMTTEGCWSPTDQYIVPIRELEEMIGWDAYACGPLFEALPVSHVIWQEDNGDIVLYSSDEGYTDGDLTEIQKFASVEEVEAYVKEQARG